MKYWFQSLNAQHGRKKFDSFNLHYDRVKNRYQSVVLSGFVAYGREQQNRGATVLKMDTYPTY